MRVLFVLFVLHLLLLGLFTQGYYLLYFFVLSLAIAILYQYFYFPSYKKIALFVMIVSAGYMFIGEQWYDIYIDYDLQFPLFYGDATVAYSLLFIHLLILFLLGYNKEKLF